MISDAGERRSRKDAALAKQVTSGTKRKRSNSGRGLSAWDRHTLYVERYIKHYDRSERHAEEKLKLLHSNDRNDWDVLRTSHRFLREADEAASSSSSTEYADEVAKKYYDSLFKDYVIADLKHYKRGDVAMRWRSEDDVIGGTGQFTCGNRRCKHHLSLQDDVKLEAFEVNFVYSELNAKDDDSLKIALVKIILCPHCARKLSHARKHSRKDNITSSETKSESLRASQVAR